MTATRETLREAVASPGSDEAIAKGCICAVLDNGRGKGAYGKPGQFWITEGCPLHAPHIAEKE